MIVMNKMIIVVLFLVLISFLLGFVLSVLISPTGTVQKGGITDFSVETKAICEDVKNSTCYYKCHDEVFLIIAGREISIQKNNEYVCHEEGWIDPRIKK
jgi:uncharacterized membrane-anchored protein YitT (DUF2179 family)